MKKSLLLFLILFLTQYAFSQKWIDTTYQYQQTNNIVYDTAIDFAGNSRELLLNVCVPMNDTPPTCGRPLLIAIHGGAFLSGNKDSDAPPLWMRDFAKRGYTTASINYRLGMFHTNLFNNCNVSAFGFQWNCLNIQDTTEWYRSWYRAMQDTKTAIRFLVDHATTYGIDPRNVFLVGESAGGFTALAAAFLDDDLEKPIQCGAVPNALTPNALYENQCIQTPGFDTSIASMNLTRPDLGGIDGNTNSSAATYTIKGVGNFFGGMMTNLFQKTNYTQQPVLYMFHQPNDLVVPIDSGDVYSGVESCFMNWPASCGYFTGQPKLYGSRGIRNLILNAAASSISVPTFQYDSTLNNSDCIGQINATGVGHAIDNYWLRTLHMAQLFASVIDVSVPCGPNSVSNPIIASHIQVYPNPIVGDEIILKTNEKLLEASLYSIEGKRIAWTHSNILKVQSSLPSGIYILKIKTIAVEMSMKLIK